MRIEAKNLASPAAGAVQRRPAAGRAFTVEGEKPAEKAAATAPAVPLAGLEALLALQGQDDPGERRRRSVKRGHDLLDALDRLKAALLGGRVPVTDLQRIAARLAERHDGSGDPRLDDLISHIELRARVELAKLGVP